MSHAALRGNCFDGSAEDCALGRDVGTDGLGFSLVSACKPSGRRHVAQSFFPRSRGLNQRQRSVPRSSEIGTCLRNFRK